MQDGATPIQLIKH